MELVSDNICLAWLLLCRLDQLNDTCDLLSIFSDLVIDESGQGQDMG